MDQKELLELKTAKSLRSIERLIAARWSPYGYSNKPVPKEDLAALFEAASWASSSFNEQPWRYLVASRQDDPAGYERLLGCLMPANQAWAKAAPVLALSVAKSTFTRNDNPNRVAVHDVGAASATLTFEATARGLVVHQMAGVNLDHARTVCGVPTASTSSPRWQSATSRHQMMSSKTYTSATPIRAPASRLTPSSSPPRGTTQPLCNGCCLCDHGSRWRSQVVSTSRTQKGPSQCRSPSPRSRTVASR